MIYFTSDSHFFHQNSIEFTGRPFKSIEEMGEGLIDNWNSVVTPKDSVYHLGDFSFGRFEKSLSIFNRLNGNKFLLKGNHCSKDICKLPWGWVKDTYGLKWEGEYIWLAHYPHMSWNRSYHGAVHACGHVHSKGEWWFHRNSCDVGVDYWNYYPVAISDFLSHLKRINSQAVERGLKHFMWKGPKDQEEFEFLEIPTN